MNRLRGFTLVELMVVIAVIGILATIVTIGLTRYQADTRDARRLSSATVISEALEKYYEQNGEYPSCAEIEKSADYVVTNLLKGIDKSALTAPGASAGTNSLKCQTLTTSSSDFFQYLGDGTASCATTSCLYFAIKYKDEASKSVKSVESRHSPAVDTPTNIAAVVDSGTQITVTWNAANNVSSYVVQRADSEDFETGANDYATSTNSKVFTDESPGVTHFYRVKGIRGSDESRWSEVVQATPGPPAPTCLAVTTDSSTQQTVSWSAVSSALSYKIERATNSGFSSPVVVGNFVSGTSKAITGLNQGTTYYYRVYGIANGGALGEACAPAVSGTTTLGAPAAYAITGSASGANITVTSNAICPAGSTGDYTWTAGGSAWPAAEGLQSATRSQSMGQSITYVVNSRCYNATVGYSPYTQSSPYTYTRPVSAPSMNGLSVSGRRVTSSWSNPCSGSYQLYLRQGSYEEYTGWTGSNSDARNWYSPGTVYYQVRTVCNSTYSGWSGAVSAYVNGYN